MPKFDRASALSPTEKVLPSTPDDLFVPPQGTVLRKVVDSSVQMKPDTSTRAGDGDALAAVREGDQWLQRVKQADEKKLREIKEAEQWRLEQNQKSLQGAERTGNERIIRNRIRALDEGFAVIALINKELRSRGLPFERSKELTDEERKHRTSAQSPTENALPKRPRHLVGLPKFKKRPLEAPAPGSHGERVPEPPASGVRVKGQDQEADPLNLPIELELDKQPDALIAATPFEPASRLEEEAAAAEAFDKEKEENQDEDVRMRKVVSQDPEVIRLRGDLDAVPIVVENVPARIDIETKIRKAELLAEQRETERLKKMAKKEADSVQQEIQNEESRIKELNERLAIQQEKLDTLREALAEQERQRADLILKKEETVDASKNKQRAKADEALQGIQAADDALYNKLRGLESIDQTKLTKQQREDLEADKTMIAREREKIEKNRAVVRGNIDQNESVRKQDTGKMTELIARADASVLEAEQSVGRQEWVVEKIQDQLAQVKLDHHQHVEIYKDAVKREDNAKLQGVEIAISLAGLAAVLLEDDPVPEPTPEPPMPLHVVREPPMTDPSAWDRTKAGAKKVGRGARKGAGVMGKYVGFPLAVAAAGLGKGISQLMRFPETFFKNLYDLTMHPEKFFSKVQSRFGSEMKDDGFMGFGRGMKWLLVGDPDKKKAKSKKED